MQGALPEAYTGLRTSVYEGWIMFPSAWVQLKLYEPGPFYTMIGFGSITWHGLTINMNRYRIATVTRASTPPSDRQNH